MTSSHRGGAGRPRVDVRGASASGLNVASRTSATATANRRSEWIGLPDSQSKIPARIRIGTTGSRNVASRRSSERSAAGSTPRPRDGLAARSRAREDRRVAISAGSAEASLPGPLLPLPPPALRPHVVQPLAHRAEGIALGVAGRDPHLPAQRDDRGPVDERLGQLVLVDVVGEAVMAAFVEAI